MITKKSYPHNKSMNIRTVNEYNLIIWLLENKPDSKYLLREGPGTKTYDNVTKWCNVDTDLSPVKRYPRCYALLGAPDAEPVKTDTIYQTNSYCLYDKVTKSFVTLNESFYDEAAVMINLDSILPEGVRNYIEIDQDFIDESLFPDGDLVDMEKCGAISPRYAVSTQFCTRV